jgi:hypothetical protein
MVRHHSIARLAKTLFAARRAQTHVATAPRRTIELVASGTETAHRVTDEAFAAGRHAGGRYVTVCGAEVLPASLTAPPRRYCPACEWWGA